MDVLNAEVKKSKKVKNLIRKGQKGAKSLLASFSCPGQELMQRQRPSFLLATEQIKEKSAAG